VSRYALYIIHLEYMNIRVNITYREAGAEEKKTCRHLVVKL